MMKQRIAALLLAGLMLLSLSACGGGGDSSAGGSSGDKEGAYKMSVILKTTASEHWQLIMAGCRKFESEHPDVVIDITGPANETSYDDQQNMIETTLNNSEVDAIIIAPSSRRLPPPSLPGRPARSSPWTPTSTRRKSSPSSAPETRPPPSWGPRKPSRPRKPRDGKPLSASKSPESRETPPTRPG